MEEFIDGKLKRFLLIRPSEVQRRVAELAVKAASRNLGISPPEVKFFAPDCLETLRGFCTDEAIFIAAGQTDSDVAKTAVHEARHCWQRQQRECRTWTEQRRERDARLFELQWPR